MFLSTPLDQGLAGRLEHKPEAIEHQLAHAVPDKLGSVYKQTKFIRERHAMSWTRAKQRPVFAVISGDLDRPVRALFLEMPMPPA